LFVTNLGWTLEELSTDQDRHDWAVLRTISLPDPGLGRERASIYRLLRDLNPRSARVGLEAVEESSG
jgi:hypothetical protein